MSEMEEPVIRREFPVEFTTDGDGRTLDLRIVPYNTVARVSDGREPYDEMWMPEVFDRQMSAANRVDVLVNFEHERGIGGVVGRGVELRETPAGAEGTFRILRGTDGDKVLELVNEHIVTGVSLEGIPTKTVREDGIVKRVKARLVNIALCRMPAFVDAQVLAVREEPKPEPDEPDEPAPEEPELVTDPMFVDQLLERLGWTPLVTRATTDRPWDGSAARFTDEQYQRSALFCRPGDEPPKTRCSLPVLEPDGTLNTRALGAAAGRLNQVTNVSSAQKASAARKLIRYYGQANMEPPASLRALASR